MYGQILNTLTSTLSRSPKQIADAPVVNIPPLNNTLGPIRLRYCP